MDGIGRATDAFFERFGRLSSPAHIDSALMEEFCAALEGESPLTEEPVAWSLGGGVAIMAKAALALGTSAEVWANVGRDGRGRFLTQEMAGAGAATHFLLSDLPTGIFCSLSTIDGGKRIIVNPGAARDIRGTDMLTASFRPGWIFYIDGLLIDSPSWLASQAEKAKAKRMTIAMDLSTPANAKRYASELVHFAEDFCDLVFANEDEFAALGQLPRHASKDKTAWVVKRGGHGSILLKEGRIEEAAAVKTEAIDDTGAGDVFAAGFLNARFEGRTDGECLRLGNAVAAAALRFHGSNFNPAALKRAYEDERLAIIADKIIH